METGADAAPTGEMQLNVGVVTITIGIVVAMGVMGFMTRTAIAYLVFVALSILAYRFRERIGMANSLSRTFLVFGGIAVASGALGGVTSLSIPGGIFAAIGGIMTKIEHDRDVRAERETLLKRIAELETITQGGKRRSSDSEI